jgi:hypothetical protein
MKPIVVELAGKLHSRWQTAHGELRGDPWRDAEFAMRMTNRVERLIDDLEPTDDLSPISVAILVLTPMAQQVWSAESAVALLDVNPIDMHPWAAAGRRRRDYEQYLSGPAQSRLVSRTELAEMDDRRGLTEPRAIEWWLFHQWVNGPSHTPLSHSLDIAEPKLNEVLTSTIKRLTQLFRLTPNELRDEEHLRDLDTEAVPLDLQEVNEQLLGLLLTVAHQQAIHPLSLPESLVEHLGIPRAVNLEQFRTTIRDSRWLEKEGIAYLIADCQHEAVFDSLRNHVEQTTAVLGAIRAVARRSANLEPLKRLPLTASSDRVRPAKQDGEPVFSVPVARFRLDETRIRELLMGLQLYGDKSLAIREMYQNALDACRWRRARMAANGVRDWEGGRIRFEQGVKEGRHYLQCTDTGIGMTESDLREVFSKAGVRFTERREFREEKSAWELQSIPFFPNSRFGIGVLSYFMLADEIEVRTKKDGESGHALKAMIAGPGHLFRIERHAGDHPVGTTVTLYLRDGRNAPSCVEVLQRILGIAEFHTIAVHDSIPVTWKPYEFEVRHSSRDDLGGIDVFGEVLQCNATPTGQVIWCGQHSGGLLVDGIYVSLPDEDDTAIWRTSTIRGALVNLTGQQAPPLTVDRASVKSDVTRSISDLMISAIPRLLEKHPRFFTYEWLCEVSEETPAVGDAITAALIDSATHLSASFGNVNIASTGCMEVQSLHVTQVNDVCYAERERLDYLENHVVLWQLLVHHPRVLAGFAIQHPHPLPPFPSDGLTQNWALGLRSENQEQISPGSVTCMALALDTDPSNVVSRLHTLGYDIDPTAPYPDTQSISADDLALLSKHWDSKRPWLIRHKPVRIGHLFGAHRRTDIPVADIIRRMADYGFDTRQLTGVPDPEYRDQFLASRDVDGDHPWLDRDLLVCRSHVFLVAFKLGLEVPAVVDRMREIGFSVEPTRGFPAWIGEVSQKIVKILLAEISFNGDRNATQAQVVQAAAWMKISPQQAATRLIELGFTIPADTDIPDMLEELDVALINKLGTEWKTYVMPDELSQVANDVGCTLRTAASRLTTLGFPVPSGYLAGSEVDEIDQWLAKWIVSWATGPENLKSESAVLKLLVTAARTFDKPYPELVTRIQALRCDGSTYSDIAEPSSAEIPLAWVLDAAQWTNQSPQHMLERLRALQFSPFPAVPPPNWSDSLNTQLVGRLDLREAVSVGDVLRAALDLRLTLEDVLDRFMSLGLEVPDMAAELPPLLAKVPFKS